MNAPALQSRTWSPRCLNTSGSPTRLLLLDPAVDAYPTRCSAGHHPHPERPHCHRDVKSRNYAELQRAHARADADPRSAHDRLWADRPRERRARHAYDDVPYQAEIEEGLGAAVAILIDTSGSMREPSAWRWRPKHLVARDALETMLAPTDAFVARRPDFPIKIGLYSFSSEVRRLRRVQPYERAAIGAGPGALPRPGGGTAIGEALAGRVEISIARACSGNIFWSLTDGENTSGRRPDEMAPRDLEQEPRRRADLLRGLRYQPGEFGFLKEAGGDVFGAGTGGELLAALDGIYQGRILAEAPDAVEPNRSGSKLVVPFQRRLRDFSQVLGRVRRAINKVANLFWEADPIAQMRYEYDQAVEQLKEGRNGLEQYRGLVERVTRQAAAKRARQEARSPDQGLPEGRRSRDRREVRARAAEGEKELAANEEQLEMHETAYGNSLKKIQHANEKLIELREKITNTTPN